MIVYEATKKEFLDDVLNDSVTSKIYSEFKNKLGHSTSEKEIRSWKNSMMYMHNVLSTDAIPADCGIAVEYRIPRTSNRIDFIITGLDNIDNKYAVIVELKQWDAQIEAIYGKDGIVRTKYFGGKLLPHPSYQALSYASLITDYNESIRNEQIKLYPCAYLHNYVPTQKDPIFDAIYEPYTSASPVFVSGDALKLRGFISQYIKKPDQKKVLYIIENGKICPSKSLQDSLVKMLQNNEEFIMIDEQKVVLEEALFYAKDSFSSGKKNVIIVEGGPGTGKSVLAINLLVKLTAESMVCNYITKNSAPREVYSQKLREGYKKKFIDNLFKGSGVFHEAQKDDFDVLIVDEAHRLSEKSGMFKNKGENQTKEIINASKFSIFFIDESQRVHINDAGRKSEIITFAKLAGANVIELKLNSQFRCNGSDGYLAWLDDVLEINETANYDDFDFEYDFKIFDDPNELRDAISELNKTNNKSRLVAGYCWNWLSEGRSKEHIYDINIDEYDFHMSWNLDNTSTWAIDEDSVSQAGCIHTSQGLEFDYVGVIIGNDMSYSHDHISTDYKMRAKTDRSLRGIKKATDNDEKQIKKIADEIIKNTYRTLMTRGQKGCYVYCCDKNLRDYLLSRTRRMNEHYTAAPHDALRVAENKTEYK